MGKRSQAARAEQQLHTDPAHEQFEPVPPHVEQATAEYVGCWHRLVSTTNWEKGRIILSWRQALVEAGAPAGSYSDEAWTRRVGNVSAQHVGRLRRVYQRFGQTYERYAGLFWSHFQAALDWSDAEMWLEGAVQNGWSVAQMRDQRWQAIGAPPELKPREADIIAAELDEDVDPANDPVPQQLSGSLSEVRAPAAAEGPDDAPAEIDGIAQQTDADVLAHQQEASAEPDRSGEPLRPFADLPPLPADLDEAFESFKLAILHHKLSGWREISCEDVLAVLQSLEQLALAPAEQ